MMKKTEILDLCKAIAEDYPEWEFSAQAFKNKALKHTVKLVHPLWSFSPGSALAQPLAGILNKNINKIFKDACGISSEWTSGISLPNSVAEYKAANLRFYDIIADDAEAKIRKFLDDGIRIIDETYDFSSEENLLKNMPKYIEGQDGIKYCIARAYLGDFEFVKLYREDKIKTIRPKLISDIDAVMKYFDIK